MPPPSTAAIEPDMPSPSDSRFQIVISKELLKRVDKWRGKQEDVPNKSEAIRRLLEIALEKEDGGE